MHVRRCEFAPASELDDRALLEALRRLLNGPLVIRRDEPGAVPGEVWLRRSWLVTAHRRARHWQGERRHHSYAGTSRRELLRELADMLAFDYRAILESTDARDEIDAVYEGLRELWERSEWTYYRRELVISR